jgi:hypothetical protein
MYIPGEYTTRQAFERALNAEVRRMDREEREHERHLSRQQNYMDSAPSVIPTLNALSAHRLLRFEQDAGMRNVVGSYMNRMQ